MDLKVNEVAALLDETPNVIRNWLRDFKGLIPVNKAANGYNLYSPEAVEVIRTIKRLHRDQGYSTRQIENYLSGGELAAAVELTEPPAASAEVAEIKDLVQQLMIQQQESQKQQLEFNKVLIERLEQRDKMLTDYILQRRLELKQQEQTQEKQTLIGRIKKMLRR